MDLLTTFDQKASLIGAQFGAGAIGTYTSTNSYDTAPAGTPNPSGPSGAIGGPLLHDYGRGMKGKFFAQITTTVTSAGATTLELDFITSANQDLSAAVVLIPGTAVALASLVQGYRFRHSSYTPGLGFRRYIGCQIIIAVAALTAGAYSAGIMADLDDHYDTLG